MAKLHSEVESQQPVGGLVRPYQRVNERHMLLRLPASDRVYRLQLPSRLDSRCHVPEHPIIETAISRAA